MCGQVLSFPSIPAKMRVEFGPAPGHKKMCETSCARTLEHLEPQQFQELTFAVSFMKRDFQTTHAGSGLWNPSLFSLRSDPASGSVKQHPTDGVRRSGDVQRFTSLPSRMMSLRTDSTLTCFLCVYSCTQLVPGSKCFNDPTHRTAAQNSQVCLFKRQRGNGTACSNQGSLGSSGARLENQQVLSYTVRVHFLASQESQRNVSMFPCCAAP